MLIYNTINYSIPLFCFIMILLFILNAYITKVLKMVQEQELVNAEITKTQTDESDGKNNDKKEPSDEEIDNDSNEETKGCVS